MSDVDLQLGQFAESAAWLAEKFTALKDQGVAGNDPRLRELQARCKQLDRELREFCEKEVA